MHSLQDHQGHGGAGKEAGDADEERYLRGADSQYASSVFLCQFKSILNILEYLIEAQTEVVVHPLWCS